MVLKYNIEIDNKNISDRLKQLINLVYKLLPMREEDDANWQTLLSTIMEEIAGMHRLLPEEYNDILFSLLCKLEGLFTLTSEDSFFDFRRTIFESLNLMNKVREKCQL